MKVVGKQQEQIPHALASSIGLLIALALRDTKVLLWLRDAVLMCLGKSDFEKEKHNIRSLIQHLDYEMLESLLAQCLDSEWPNDKVRSYIVEEYVKARIEQGMSGCVILRQATLYDDAGTCKPCGEANLDVFAGNGLFNTHQLCLSIDANSPCIGYECKVKVSSWLSVKQECLDEKCKVKLDYMACLAAKLPNATIRIASLEDGFAVSKARETLSAFGYGRVEVLSITEV